MVAPSNDCLFYHDDKEICPHGKAFNKLLQWCGKQLYDADSDKNVAGWSDTIATLTYSFRQVDCHYCEFWNLLVENLERKHNDPNSRREFSKLQNQVHLLDREIVQQAVEPLDYGSQENQT